MDKINEKAFSDKDINKRYHTIIRREDKSIEILLGKRFYQKEAVFAAAHSITDKYRVKIEPAENNNVKIILIPMPSAAKINEQEVIDCLINRLIDEQVRLDLEKRYGKIRELIIEHAFSPLENLRAKIREIAGRE